MVFETDFSSYARLTNAIIDTSARASTPSIFFLVADEVNQAVYFYDSLNTLLQFTTFAGAAPTTLVTASLSTASAGLFRQSLNGKYLVLNTEKLPTTPNGQKLLLLRDVQAFLTLDDSDVMVGNTTEWAITPSGRYVVHLGRDKNSANMLRLVVWQGS